MIPAAQAPVPIAAAAPRCRAVAPRPAPIPSRNPASRRGRLIVSFGGVALDRPRVMAIVNVTPDSFSDGGERLDKAQAIDDGLRFVSEGADFVDIGGEATRAGSQAARAQEGRRPGVPG